MIWTHLRQSFRVFRREPGFAIFAVLTLALGIGASTAMFSVFHGVLLAPVAHADASRVVAINTRWTDTGRQSLRVSGGDWMELAEARDTFEALGRYHGGEVGVQLRDRAEWANVFWVSPDFFRVFGVAPATGRSFGPSDEERSIAVSTGFANRIFGSAAWAIGQVVHIDTHPYDVVAVMPADFQFPAKADIWVAVQALPENRNRTAFNYQSVARLRPGVGLVAAGARLEALGGQLAKAYPENKSKYWTVVPVRENLTRNVRSTVVLLMGSVMLLLLIACANVAHLLLARAAARTREFAVRSALGAATATLLKQLLAESLALGVAGGAAGIAIAYAGVRAVQALAPENLPRIGEIGVDWTVLAFGIGVALASSLLFGLAPAWQVFRTDVRTRLGGGGARGIVGGRAAGLRTALVACEIALSFALAVGAGLLIRSFVELNSVSLGFRTEGILVAYAHAPADTMEKMRASTRFFERALAELESTTGVKSAAAAMGLPAGRYGSNGKYAIEGMDATHADPNRLPEAGFRLASRNYFATLGIPLLRGRDFSERDQYDQEFVAIVSESLARQSFGNQDPIGRKIMCGLDTPDKWMTIVGVVGDVRSDGPGRAPVPELYMPFQQHPIMANELQVAVRTTGAPEALAETVIRKIRLLSPEIALKTTTMRAMVADSISTPRFRTFLMTLFAAVALTLATAGVYGVMAYLVAQRTPELGLRMALGSAPSGVVRLVLGRAWLLAAAGLAAGAALAYAGSRWIESLLFGITATDVWGYVFAGAAIGVITLAAAALPAWRAARIDPAIALRQE